MGGVDLNDMLTSLYRVDIQTRNRYYLKIVTHCVNICNVSAWSLYKIFSDQLDIPKKEQCSLLNFTEEVADALLSAGKGPKKQQARKDAALPSLSVNQSEKNQW